MAVTRRAEGDAGIKVSADDLAAIPLDTGKGGVIFVAESGEGPGVRLKEERR